MGPRRLLTLCIASLFAAAVAAPSHAATTITLISHADGNPTKSGDDLSHTVTMSPNGRYVVFASLASNFIDPFQDNNATGYDIYRFDRTDATTVLVSHAHDDAASGADDDLAVAALVADDGSVFFRSDADNHVNGYVDNNVGNDLFVFDGSTGTIRLLSGAARSATLGANGDVTYALPSDDGTGVGFASSATNLALVPFTDTNSDLDVFFVDVSDPALPVDLVSHTAASDTTTGSHYAQLSAYSGDGTTILFGGPGSNHVAPFTDNNGPSGGDLYRYTVSSGLIELVSRSASNATHGALTASADSGLLSTDGRYATYTSDADNLVAGFEDNNAGSADLFEFDASTGKTTLVSHRAGSSKRGSDGTVLGSLVSAAGKHVLFTSDASDHIAGFSDGNGVQPDVYLFTLKTGGIKLVSHRSGSAKAGSNGAAVAVGNRFQPTSFTYLSTGSNLISNFTDNGPDPTLNVFRYSKKPGKKPKTTLVSHAHDNVRGGADRHCGNSADAVTAKVAAFSCDATNLIAGFVAADPEASNVYDAEF